MKLKNLIVAKIKGDRDLQWKLAGTMKRKERNIEELAKRNHNDGKLTTIAAIKVIMEHIKSESFEDVVE